MSQGRISRDEARKKVYYDQLTSWLGGRAADVRNRMTERKSSTLQYEQLCQNLKREHNPAATMAYLLNFDDESYLSPRQVGRKATEIMDHKVSKSPLSPALLLSEQKRKSLLRRLEQSEYLVEDDSDVFTKLKTKQPHSPSSTFPSSSEHNPPHKARPLSPGRDFEPKWEHYNTMRTRWRYLMPQVKDLVHEDSAFAPTSSTSFISVKKVPLAGNYVDLKHYNQTVDANLSKSMSFTARSKLMTREAEQRRQEQIYIPKPFVRHPK